MSKYLIWTVCFLLPFYIISTFAAPKKYSTKLFTTALINLPITYHDNTITIVNPTLKNINLRNAILQFQSLDKIESAFFLDGSGVPVLSITPLTKMPHNNGNLYYLKFSALAQPILLPEKKFRIKLTKAGPHLLQDLKIMTASPLPVNMQVSVANLNYVETISICNNTSGLTIPMSNVEFDFNYTVPMPTNIWGNPYAAWKLASQTGSAVVLTGGTPYTVSLPPDPTCANPLTIQFNTAPTTPAPMAPFVFKAEGMPDVTTGQLSITLPAIPTAGLPNPVVTVTGTNFSQQQTVAWGGNWTLTNVLPGNYTINATAVNNGTNYYYAPAMNATVTANVTTSKTVAYIGSSTGNVTITLTYPPGTAEPITFTGTHYDITKSVISGQVVTLPADTYTVTSTVPGYIATLTPSSITVPTNTTLNATYASNPISNSVFVGYFQSSAVDSQTTDGTQTNLANLPSYITVVNLAFMQPDASYIKGSLNYSTTGLGFNYASGAVLKKAIAYLHAHNPLTKVLVSIGGPAYTNWGSLNVTAIANFVSDFDLDGIDINYEPATPGCALDTDKLIHCSIDSAFQGYVNSLKNALSQKAMLTITGWSVGAYGQDSWTAAQPQNQYTGMMLPLLRSSVASSINMVNVMSYDAGSTYNPTVALAAYTNYFTGQVNMGVEVPPEVDISHVYTLCNVLNLTETVVNTATTQLKSPGMMIWSLQKVPIGTTGSDNPTAQLISEVICSNLGLFNCAQTLLINGFNTVKHAPLKLVCH